MAPEAARRVFRTSVCLLFVFGCAAPASAQWKLGAFIGAAHTTSAQMSIVQPAVATNLVLDPVTFAGRSFESPFYYGFRLSHDLWFMRPLRVEAELIHAKVYADTDRTARAIGVRNGMPVDSDEPLNRSIEQFSMSHGLNFILFNAVGELPPNG